MDAMLQQRFTERWRQYFGQTELPIGFYFTEQVTTADLAASQPERGCLIGSLSRVRQGYPFMYAADTAGCRYYDLGGINPESNPGVFHFKAGMGGEECHQLGRYEHVPSALHRRALRWVESSQRQWRRRRGRSSSRKHGQQCSVQ